MNMNKFEAIGIAEGFIECDDAEIITEAWQHLIDTGACWHLQGWFGRQANRLIEEGICTLPDSNIDLTTKLKENT
tara:strand:- start:14526 stop:14750 length:225 start_codon:yes stop_codon:yes gene_type:complete